MLNVQSLLYEQSRSLCPSIINVGFIVPVLFFFQYIADFNIIVTVRWSYFQVLMDVFCKIFQKGCINILSVHQMEALLALGGTQWFCDSLVKVSAR